MRPDIEDYEELTNAADAPRSRAMSWLVLVVAIGGFAALAFYAYHSGTQTAKDGEVLVVQADESPIKQIPEDAEGEQFANKDKTIYDVIAPSGAAVDKGEKLLPEPERPMSAARDLRSFDDVPDDAAPAVTVSRSATQTPTTYVNKNLPSATAVDPVDVQSVKPVESAVVKPAAPVVTAKPVVKTEPKVLVEKPAVEPKVEGAPTFVNEPLVAKKEPAPTTPKLIRVKKETAVTKAPAKTETAAVTSKAETAEAKPVKAASANGSRQIQLGAYQSEAEAQAAWKKISGKFPAVLNGAPTIVKAELPNGTFYRLRAGSFSAEAAKTACAVLSAQKQPCFPIGK